MTITKANRNNTVQQQAYITVQQSYIFTAAAYDYDVYEKRITYKVVEQLQPLLEGKKLGHDYSDTIVGDYEVVFPISTLMIDGSQNNGYRVKKNLFDLMSPGFTVQTAGGRTTTVPFFAKVTINDGMVHASVQREVVQAFVNLSQGARKYNLDIAFNFSSRYSMRLYELFSRQTTPMRISMEDLRERFGSYDKHVRANDFICNIISTSKHDLDTDADWTFDFHPIKTGRRITDIEFYPANKTTQAQPIFDFLKSDFGFNSRDIDNCYQEVRLLASKRNDVLLFITNLKPRATTARKPKDYVINTIRAELAL
jgi:hypothetical protein